MKKQSEKTVYATQQCDATRTRTCVCMCVYVCVYVCVCARGWRCSGKPWQLSGGARAHAPLQPSNKARIGAHGGGPKPAAYATPLPPALRLTCTLRKVVAVMWSPSRTRLNVCHMSSAAVAGGDQGAVWGGRMGLEPHVHV